LARRSSVRSSDVAEPKIAARAPDLRRRRRRRSSAATSDESLVLEKTGYGTYAIIGYGAQFLLLPSAATAVLPGPVIFAVLSKRGRRPYDDEELVRRSNSSGSNFHSCRFHFPPTALHPASSTEDPSRGG